MLKTYTELSRYDTFEDRYRYLALGGVVAEETFGHDRWVNQDFYRSREWKQVRHYVAYRDLGCDLGIEGYEIHDEREVRIHHMNPMTVDDVVNFNPDILDPEFLITTCLITHNAIHFGDERQLPRQFAEREPGDTDLW